MLFLRYLNRHFKKFSIFRRTQCTLVDNISQNYILKSEKKDIEIPNITLPELLTTYQDKFEKYVASECAFTKRKYSYGELRDYSTSLSKALKKILKLKSENVVAVICRNIPEYPIACLGIIKANLIVTTISSVFSPDEICRQMIDSDTKALITEVGLYANVRLALDNAKKKVPIVIIKTEPGQVIPENTIDFHEVIKAKHDYPNIIPNSPNSVAVMPYSSGTTGLPKGVELTHRNLVANILQCFDCDMEYQTEASDTYQEVIPTVLPYYHIFGLSLLFGVHLSGGNMVSISSYSQDLFVSVLKEYRTTLLYLVPPLVLMITHNEAVKRESLDRVKAILSGGAPLSATDEQKLLEKFDHEVLFLQGYGLTETSPVVAELYPSILIEEKYYKGSIGKPLPNTLTKIVNPEDAKNTPLGPNCTGELLVKGPQVMKGYHKLPEETKKIMSEDGWLRSGDLGHFNEKGFLFITDRMKELIKVKGNQVAPSELEGIIRSFPGVADAAVIGIPHERAGEVPRAYIVAEENLNIEKLQEFFNGKVAKYKQLKGGIELVESIPKNASGKILRRELRTMYLDKNI
ncbi:hypothetical protein WA026_009019 [Henosepilachna vigintioctopunctata]|uniref:4-coumarate--CoA ligase n=1 Tax=Henosepilachna vigintioctopunctata TaxID=420089 RepID=A0AAW1UY71_9CUCU